MPFDLEFDEQKKWFIYRVTGADSSLDAFHRLVSMISDPRMTRDTRILADMTHAEELHVYSEDLRMLKSFHDKYQDIIRNSKWALVVRDDIVYEMLKCIVPLNKENRQTVGLFRDLEEAERWLRMEAPCPSGES
jgi:hypothetical protein